MKKFIKIVLLTTLFSLTFQANAGLVFYDWTPEQGEGGEGFFVFDTTNISDDPANFLRAPLVDLFFQFVPTGPSYTLDDFPTRTRLFTAEDGIITNFNFNLVLNTFADTLPGRTLSTSIDFTRSSANCLSVSDPDPTGTFTVFGEGCEGPTSTGGDFFFRGQWTLRESVAAVPSPQTLGLFTLGLLFIILRKQRQNIS